MSEKRDRRTPTRHARRKARARSTRVSTHFLDADTLFANDTPFGVSAADPSRAPIATGVAPTPRAYASDRTDTVKKVDGGLKTRRRLQDQQHRGRPGHRAAADLQHNLAAEGSSKSRKSVHNVTRARHAERLRRKAPARFEDHVPLDLLLRRGGVHSEAHLRRHAWPRHDVRGTRSPRTIARCRGSRPKFDRKRPEARPRGSPSVDLSRRPAPSLLLPRDGASGPPSRAPSADLP